MHNSTGDASRPCPPGDGRPRLVGRVGSLDAFWPLMEPLLTRLRPRRLCEIGLDQGLFTDRLLSWGQANDCAYVGIDPSPDPAVAGRIEKIRTPPGRMVAGRSLEILPELEPCEAYFIDGDHNYHTVRHELELIARADPTVGPLVFAHDVGWPFARRDMYHEPDTIPSAARRPFSADLGVSLDHEELVPGGFRSPGRYAIARQPGGERNGVLTAVEDFLRDHAGRGWHGTFVPVAFGLAILYRPASIPEPCRAALEQLDTACETMGRFLESCEANYLSLYLYAEAAKSQLAYWTGDGQPGQAAFEQSQRAYQELHGAYEGLSAAYQDLSTHSEKLMRDYHRLMSAYTELARASRQPEAT